MNSLKRKAVGGVIIIALSPIYVYGFMRFKFWDIMIPAIAIIIAGFTMLYGIWLIRYRGKEEVNRS